MVGKPKTPSYLQTIPILQSGDHLTRAEFERRYSAMPNVKKAELIEGIVYMASPVRFQHHGNPCAAISGCFWYYASQTPGISVAGNATVRLDINNEPQPDALMIIRPGHGGRVVIGADDYIEGAPELVAEVAASTVSIDLHEKLQAYCRNQVQEYLVWRVENSMIDWFVLREREYVKLPLIAGVFRSEVFPGLWLDHDALVGGDSPRVFQVLQEGLASPEHAAFVQKLTEAEKELKRREDRSKNG